MAEDDSNDDNYPFVEPCTSRLSIDFVASFTLFAFLSLFHFVLFLLSFTGSCLFSTLLSHCFFVCSSLCPLLVSYLLYVSLPFLCLPSSAFGIFYYFLHSLLNSPTSVPCPLSRSSHPLFVFITSLHPNNFLSIRVKTLILKDNCFTNPL